MTPYVVKAAFDEDPGVWTIEHTDIPGLATEAPTFEELRRKIEVMAPELLEANGVEIASAEAAVEIVAHATARISIRVA
jgi:hypothetical protein